MLCKNCPALKTEGCEYPESFCALGRQGETYRKGQGCRLGYRVIQKHMEKLENAESMECGKISDWYKKQEKMEQAMLEAVNEQLRSCRNGKLFLCLQDDQGRFCPIAGDDRIFPELAAMIQRDYEKRKRRKEK